MSIHNLCITVKIGKMYTPVHPIFTKFSGLGKRWLQKVCISKNLGGGEGDRHKIKFA